jgi:hypothetical protein
MNFIRSPYAWSTARVVIVVLLACVFTAWCVSASKQRGRLSSSPNYDDVVYFNQGALLLEAMRADGPGGAKNFLNEYGLHSPYSTGLAAVAFATLGPAETSPYLANVLVVTLYLGGVAWLGRRLRPMAWLAMLPLALALPFITMGVVEFRPDIAWSIIAGFGVVFIVTQDELFRHPARAAVAGLFLALALLIKPSTFVMTGLLFTGAVVSRLVAAWREGRLRSCSLRGPLAFVVTLLIVAGPYWLRFWGDTWHYFFDNAFGINKSIWTYGGGRHKALLYYINGEAYDSNLAAPGLVLISLVLGAVGYLLARHPPSRWPILSLAVLLAGVFFVNTAAQMKSPFLGGGIYGVLIFGGFYLIATAAERLGREKSPRLVTCLLWVFALGAIPLYHWPSYSDWTPNPERNAAFRNATRFINDLLDKHRESPPRRIMVMQAGPIVPEVVSLWFPLHGLKAMVHNGAFTPDAAKFTSIYPAFDWVVIQDPGVLGNTPNLPSEAQLPAFLRILEADPAYRPIAEYASADQRKIRVYARLASVP